MIVQFDYAIGDQVRIRAIEMPGRIIALMLDAEGPAYRVCYWSDGSRKTEWLFAWELGA